MLRQGTHVIEPLPALSVLTLMVFLALAGGAVEAQELPESPNDEPSSFQPLMDRTDLGNVSQAAIMAYHGGVRDLKLAEKLEEKAAETDDADKRAKHEKKAAAAYERAIAQLTEAVQTKPELVEAYDPLGRSLLAVGKAEDALPIFATGLKLAPENALHKEGVAESLLWSGRIRDAASAYQTLEQEAPEAASRLLAEMKRWVAQHRSDPAGFQPEVVEALASLIEDWEQKS